MFNRFFQIFLLFFLFYTNVSAKENLEQVSLQLKWKYQFQFAGFIIAKEKGFYKDIGLDVELKEYEEGTTIIEDVLSEKSTFGINDVSLILETIKGKPIVGMMAILQESPYILMGLKSSGIQNIEDLQNKNLALYEDVSGMNILSMLKSNHINYKPNNVIFGLDKLISKEIDMLTAYSTNEPFLAREQGLEIVTLNPKDYGFESYSDILFTSQNEVKNNPQQVHDFYEASKKGWVYAFSHINETVNIIHTKYNTLKKSKEALTYEANELKKLSNIDSDFGKIDKQKIKSIAVLLNFMISGKYDLKKLDDFVYTVDNEKIYLTKQEQEYLDSKKDITMCYNTTITPYTMLKNEKPVGVSVDYLREVEKKINKKFKFIYSNTIKEQFEMAYNKECLTIPVIQTSPQSVPFVKSTIAAGRDSLVLITKIDEPYIFNMDKLSSKKIAVNRDYIHLTDYLDKNHPNIKYVKVEGNGLKEVEKGELFGAIGASIRMNYELSKNFKDTLKVMTDYPDSYIEGGIGVHIDESILLSILNKAVASMEFVEKEDVFYKWIDIKYEKTIDYTLVWQILVISFILISTVLFWNRRLKIEIKRRQEVENQLANLNLELKNRVSIEVEKSRQQDLTLQEQSKMASMGEMIENIAHQWRQPLAQINSSVLLIDAAMDINKIENDRIEANLLEIEFLTEYMSKTIQDFQNFFNPNKQKNDFSLNDVIKNSLLIVKGSLNEEHITVSTNIGQTLTYYGHQNELEQVVVVILNNAKDALKERSVISPNIDIVVQEDDKYILIEISDNAGGIKETLLEKIFEPYFTTKHKKLGAGLGLYMSKKIIEDGMNAQLQVKNSLVGLCFKISLPKEILDANG